jgi:Hypoxia induced protein conserved region
MSLFFFILALLCMLGVVASLFLGLATMGGGKSSAVSNRMMRLRILLQGAALGFLFFAYLAK